MLHFLIQMRFGASNGWPHNALRCMYDQAVLLTSYERYREVKALSVYSIKGRSYFLERHDLVQCLQSGQQLARHSDTSSSLALQSSVNVAVNRPTPIGRLRTDTSLP